MSRIAEIIGPSGAVHYRRPPNDPLVAEARATLGYSVRIVDFGPSEIDDYPNPLRDAMLRPDIKSAENSLCCALIYFLDRSDLKPEERAAVEVAKAAVNAASQIIHRRWQVEVSERHALDAVDLAIVAVEEAEGQ